MRTLLHARQGVLERSFRYTEILLYGIFGKSLIKYSCEANGNTGTVG
jgi:hypothetical protein